MCGTMNDETAHILLEEFRSFRAEITQWKQGTGERLTALETTVRPALVNNGQKSRMAAIEDRVTALEHIRWSVSGIWAAVGAVATVGVQILIHFWSGGKQ